MPARSFALALLLLLGALPAGRAAEPAAATVVLQLPPSMSSEAVKALIADLEAKGARPVATPDDPAAGDSPVSPTTATVAGQIWEATRQAVQTIPVLREVPRVWLERVEAEGGTRDVAIRFWMIALAGLAAGPLIGTGFRALADRRQTRVTEGGLARVRGAIVRFLFALASLTFFGALLWTALLCVSPGVPILEETGDQLVWAALKWRLSVIAMLIVVSPYRPDLRLLAIDDGDAGTCSRWVAGLFGGEPDQCLSDMAGRAARLRRRRMDRLAVSNRLCRSRQDEGKPRADYRRDGALHCGSRLFRPS